MPMQHLCPAHYINILLSSIFFRVIGELESQLEYERLRREKLESQLDECRREIKRLNTHIEHISTLGAVSSTVVEAIELYKDI